MDSTAVPSSGTHQAQPSAPTTFFGAPALTVDTTPVQAFPAPSEGPLATYEPNPVDTAGPAFDLMRAIGDRAAAENPHLPGVAIITVLDTATGLAGLWELADVTAADITAALDARPAGVTGGAR